VPWVAPAGPQGAAPVRSHTKHGVWVRPLADDDTMGVEALYASVTRAVVRAERLADSHEPGAKDAYLELSLLEEKIAGHIDGSSRRVRSQAGGRTGGQSGGHRARARELAERFLLEDGADGSVPA